MDFELRLRIPGWSRNEAIDGDLYFFQNESDQMPGILINGKRVIYRMKDGYAILRQRWKTGDRIELQLPMPVRKVQADHRVSADSGRIAFQRGPLVYCAEWPDNPGIDLFDITIDTRENPETRFNAELLNGAQIINVFGLPEKQTIKLIPYHLWNNRGPGEMQVWMPLGLHD